MAQLNTGFSNSFNLTPQTNSTGGAVDPYGNGTPLNVPAAGSGGPAMGPSANPAAGAAGFNRPPVDPQIAAQNGGTGGAGTPGRSFFNGSNWNPTFQQNAGYNPSQYATTETANTLAGALGSGLGLGANVMQTQNAPGSPIGPPPQQMLDFGGSDMLNAGLMAERYRRYDHATADAMTRAELALMGPRQAPNEDSQGGSMGSWSQYGQSAGGSQNLGGGQNIGQFIGENAGGAFGSRPTGGGGINPNGNPVTGQYGQGNLGQAAPNYQNYHPQAPPPRQAPPDHGMAHPPQQAPQFGNRMNYGGFGQNQQFNQANQFSGVQQLMQMLMGGQGGMLQQRGRAGQYGNGGQMSGLMGMPSFLQGRNQSAGNGFTGVGARGNPYQTRGNMSGFAQSNNQFLNKGYDPRGSAPQGSYNDNRNMILSNQ